MKVLVTGATGLVGSHLTEALVQAGHTVKALALPSTNTSLLEKLGVEIVRGNITNMTDVEQAVKDCKHVYHLAAQLAKTGVSKQQYYATNVEGTRNVALAALKMQVERLVYGSSVSVYGHIKHLPVDETTPLKPNTHYAATKLLGEQIVLSHYQQQGLPVVVARITSVVGARASQWSGLLNVIAAQKFRIIGSGENYYHLVNVLNLIDGLQRCATTKNIEGECYILADETPVTLHDFLKFLAQELGVDIILNGMPLLPFQILQIITEKTYQTFKIQLPYTHRYNLFLNSRIFNIAKAKKELGYAPKMLLADGIKQMITDYQQQKHG
ncbi:MAG: NAD-dependent epimerase/dehydratase family protein [Goleter apudmare HA4340-LM2]|jgi:nucleoside-diphosphate-sugar epimerase|nr:NAD-dependent epimerase/dehydratase family protein [Goleter apudmare HA4340-LM2]